MSVITVLASIVIGVEFLLGSTLGFTVAAVIYSISKYASYEADEASGEQTSGSNLYYLEV
jgi:hypothetical protein